MPQGPKIIKQQIHFQIEDNPNKKKVIYMYQSGFRRNESTDICLAKFIDFVLTDMDKQKHTGMILVDFQKAFDTFDLELLFEKNKYFGFWRSVIKWFESYLSNRQFLVSIYVFSEPGILKYSVPHGPILEPLLFLLYVNALPNHYYMLVPICMQMTLAFSTNKRMLKKIKMF